MSITIQSSTTVPEPQHWPLSMKPYGQNAYGDNLFRIVFAPSVKRLVGGSFEDGYVGYKVRPMYRDIGDRWIMEKWLSAFEHTRMTEEEYNLKFRDPMTGLFLTGPYPSRGTYFECHTFESASPGHANIGKLVAWIQMGRNNTAAANAAAIRESYKKAEDEQQRIAYDRVREANSAFGIRAANLGGHIKKTKTIPTLLTANELGLPLKGSAKLKHGGTTCHTIPA